MKTSDERTIQPPKDPVGGRTMVPCNTIRSIPAIFFIIALLSAILAAACSAREHEGPFVRQRTAIEKSETESQTFQFSSHHVARIPWGTAGEAFAYHEPGDGTLAKGPSAIAVDEEGNIYVLDRLAGRVVILDPSGKWLHVLPALRSDMDLATGPRHTVYLLNLLEMEVTIRDWEGTIMMKLPIPRTLHEIRHLHVDGKGRAWLELASQNAVPIGDPSGPYRLPFIFENMRKGIPAMSASWLVSIRLNEGNQADVRTTPMPETNLAVADWMEADLRFPEGVSALRLIGMDDQTWVYLVKKWVPPTAPVSLKRTLLCLDAAGRINAPIELPAVGTYKPYRDMVMDKKGNVHLILPGPSGLDIVRFTLDRG